MALSPWVEYLIVLGAQVKGTRVSKALSQRLDRAAEYLQEHEDTTVIVSGFSKYYLRIP